MCMESSTEETSKLAFPFDFNFRNYDEARKAYLNALKHDPTNQNVLRDLGNLQV